jgi:tRNA (guanine37-N1)-methyltransferase
LVRQILKGKIPDSEIERVAGGFDAVGGILILKLPEDWSIDRKKQVGELLLQRIPRAVSVWNQVSPVEGVYRLRRLEHIAGEPTTRTEYRENGVRMIVDVRAAYFSPRLSTERLRIASLVRQGETIFNMFSGVGSFSLVICKKVASSIAYSSEINEEAYELMKVNVRINRLEGRVISMFGDCREHSSMLKGRATRVIMSLPERSMEYLPEALLAACPGATIHLYSTVRSQASESVDYVWSKVRDRYDSLKLLGGRIVSEVGPRSYEVALDLLRSA